MNSTQLSVEQRTAFGRKVQALRNQGLIPGVVYGRAFETIAVQVPVKDFEVAYRQAGESTIVQLDLNGQKYPTIIKDVTREPLKDAIIHVDFHKVRLDEKLTAAIPLNFIGEAPAVRELQAILVKNMTEIEVEGLPQDLPHEIEVDLSPLTEMTSQILVKDLKIPAKVEVQAEPDAVVALVQEPAKEEEIIVASTIDDVEVIGAEKKEGAEGEESAEAPAEEKTE